MCHSADFFTVISDTHYESITCHDQRSGKHARDTVHAKLFRHDEEVHNSSHGPMGRGNLRQVAGPERLWETHGAGLPLRGVIRLWIGLGSLWNLNGRGCAVYRVKGCRHKAWRASLSLDRRRFLIVAVLGALLEA